MSQEALRSLWLDAPVGRLCAWEVAKALGLREASKELEGGEPNIPWIASRLTKVGGGSPTKQSLHELFNKVEDDSEWFPGKHSGKKRGRKPLLTPAKRRCIAQCAMAAKRNYGEEPCVAAVVASCPKATFNSKTKKPFCERTIRQVFTTDCYDFDPEHPWKFQGTLQKVFLPDSIKQHRLDMARYLLRYGEAAQWWAQHVVWFDPCASIIPATSKQYDEMRQAAKGNKRYVSDDAKLYSPNLRGPPTAMKQRQWGGTKINWFMVLARGVMHVEIMPQAWTLNGDGMASFVERLPNVLAKMLGTDAPLPRQIFTDRGTGMYTSLGKAVVAYAEAVDVAGFRLYWGTNAQRQSPDMGDVLLHETAVAWFRKRMRAEKPEVVPWQESPEQWARRCRRIVASMNKDYDVAGLCRQFPTRLQEVIESEGERLRR